MIYRGTNIIIIAVNIIHILICIRCGLVVGHVHGCFQKVDVSKPMLDVFTIDVEYTLKSLQLSPGKTFLQKRRRENTWFVIFTKILSRFWSCDHFHGIQC